MRSSSTNRESGLIVQIPAFFHYNGDSVDFPGISMDVSQRVEARLRAANVKPTRQRIEIGAVLLAGPCHLSADQISARLRESGSSVSKATVYNTLKLFSRSGIIRAVALDPSRLVYDSTIEPHHHFFNADTGELTDIDPAEFDIGSLPELPAGTRAESIELIVRLRNK